MTDAATDPQPRPKPLDTLDSWVNPTTGVGGAGDKSAGFAFVPGTDRFWTSLVLCELYEVDDISARIVDALPEAAFERGWRLEENLPAEQSEAVRDALDQFQVQKQLVRTRKWARLYGGAALYIGSDDGPQDSPLRYGGRVHFFQPYERDELQPWLYYDDPLSPKFGEPSHYRLTPIRNVATAPTVLIHESRLVVMHGVDTTPRKRAQNNGWCSSVLIRPMKAIQQFHAAFAIVLSLLGDANQNVYKWKGLADLLLRGQEPIIEARMRLLDKIRSTVRGIAVDADEEDFIRSQINVTGMDGLLDKYAIRVSSSAKMPVTVLMGTSPAGMNATGESDLRNWGSQVDVEKRDHFTPGLERCVRVLFRASNGPTGGVEPDTWSVKFPPLFAPTPREEAEIRSINAQTDQVYVDMQVLTPAQIAKARFTGDTEQQTPLVTPEDIQALEGVERPPASFPGAAAGDAALDSEDEGQVPLTDIKPVDETVAAFAAKMTAHGYRKCEHGMANICTRCGIERVRDVEPGPDGEPKWRVLWRPIGAKGMGTEEPAIDPAAHA
jgi:phage-related protein (TIGR01555 family)